MNDIRHTVADLIAAVGNTFHAIDVRAVSIFENDVWINVMAVVRLTYEDVATAEARLAAHALRYPPICTETLRIDAIARPFGDWPVLVSGVKDDGVLRFKDFETKLRQNPDLCSAGGFIRTFSEIRPFDGREWPGITHDFNMGGLNPLVRADLPFHKDIALLGYDGVFEAVSDLCQVSTSIQHPRSDFAVWVPVFANISKIRINPRSTTVEVEVSQHRNLELQAFVCLRKRTTVVDSPFREKQFIKSFPIEATSDIVSSGGTVTFDRLAPDDYLQVRLMHSHLGEFQRTEDYVRSYTPRDEINVLMRALEYFCPNDELDDLLIRAYDVKSYKISGGAAFELHITWLLGLFGLATVILGNYEQIIAPNSKRVRATVDILAAAQKQNLLLLVACTFNQPKPEDFGNLRHAADILRREVFAGKSVQIRPVLFSGATSCPSCDESELGLDIIPIIDADGIASLLQCLRNGQEARFFRFLDNPSSETLSNPEEP